MHIKHEYGREFHALAEGTTLQPQTKHQRPILLIWFNWDWAMD